MSTLNVCVNECLLTYTLYVRAEVWTSVNPILASLQVCCMCETGGCMLKYTGSLWNPYLFLLSFPGVGYLQSLSPKGISTIF